MAKRFLWFQWDMVTQTLHYVYFKPNPKEQTARIEYMLRAVTFADDGKPEIQLDVPINVRLSRNPVEDSEYIHIPCARAVPDTNFHMEIVRIDPNSSCICFQRFVFLAARLFSPGLKISFFSPSVDDQTRSLNVTVAINQPRSLRKEYTIPMNNISVEALTSTRVFFTALDGFLVMFIPGHYLQFVDCASDHDPCAGLYVPELATPLPGIDPVTFPNAFITNFETVPNDPQAMASAIYDCQSDIGYIFSIDEDALAKIFEKPSPEAHIQAVHMAICHRQDESLLKRVSHPVTFLKRLFPL